MKKLISAPNFSVHNTLASQRRTDGINKDNEMKFDLYENYHVHNVNPLNNSIGSVYGEIKQAGSYVKDRMEERIEKSKVEQAVKEKKRAEGRGKRSVERAKILVEKRAEQESKDKAIRL